MKTVTSSLCLDQRRTGGWILAEECLQPSPRSVSYLGLRSSGRTFSRLWCFTC